MGRGRHALQVLPEAGGRLEGQLGMKVQGDIKECGQGYRYQAMACYDQDTRLVETARCNSHGEECAHTHLHTQCLQHTHHTCGILSV